MTDLIQRLAEGPGSRELSDEVLLAVGWSLEGNPKDPRTKVWRAPDGKAYDWWDDPHARSREPILRRPNVTEVTDDALALVPESMIWRMEGPDNFYVVIGRPTAKGNFSQATGKWQSYGAQSLALAICIAVLKSV